MTEANKIRDAVNKLEIELKDTKDNLLAAAKTIYKIRKKAYEVACNDGKETEFIKDLLQLQMPFGVSYEDITHG